MPPVPVFRPYPLAPKLLSQLSRDPLFSGIKALFNILVMAYKGFKTSRITHCW